MAVAPSRGRAARIEEPRAPEADATRALYEQYANQIFRYCLHQLGSREEAEDAVQSTFLNAFRGIKRGVVPELESAWLFKIAHNVCLSRRRSAWRRGRVESPADFDLVEELTPAPSRRADELIGLQDVLEQLPETQRRAILLREWQGLSYREIADELELSQGAVETLIFRARRSLAAGLEQPAETRRRRAARALDWGNVVAGIKSLLMGGSVAAKVAATVAVVGATTVVATAPVVHREGRRVAPDKAPVAVHRAGRRSPVVPPAAKPQPVVHAPAPAAVVHRPARRITQRRAAGHRHRPARTVAPVQAPPSAVQTTPPAPPAPAQPVPAPPAQPDTAPAATAAHGNGNGHAYGHEKHAQASAATPTVDPAPAPPADQPADADTPAVAPPVPVVESPQNVPPGHAYGHDKSGGAPAAPVATTPGDR